MELKIIGLDINEETCFSLKSLQEIYKCTFENFNDPRELLENVNNDRRVRVVVIDINHNERIKYELSVMLKETDVAVFFVSSSHDADERVRWLSYGASAYILSPFRAEELFIRAKLHIASEVSRMMSDKNFQINMPKREVFYKGKKIKVTPRLFDLIIHFMESDGELITRESIRSNMHDGESISEKNLNTLIKQLRDETDYDIVKTVRGIGYIYT